MWTKLDDGFCEHPKTEALSDAAFRLHVAAMNYCARHLTDGFVATDKAPRLVPKFRKAAIAELVAGGQWVEVPGGYELHDFLDFHPTKAEVDEKRDKEAKRKARQRAKGTANVDQDPTTGRFMSQGDNLRDRPRDDPGDLQRPSPATRPVPSRPEDPSLVVSPSGRDANSPPVDNSGSSGSYRGVDLDQVFEHVAELRAQAAQPRNPKPWKRKVLANLPAEDGPAIRELIDRFDEPAHTIAEIHEGRRDARYLKPRPQEMTA